MAILSISSPNYKSYVTHTPTFSSRDSVNNFEYSKQNKRLKLLNENLESIKSNFDKNIAPFISDSRVLYNEVGLIGYNAQLVLNQISKSSESVFSAQRVDFDGFENACRDNFGMYLERFSEYEENQRTFKRHEEFSKNPLFENTELTKMIEESKQYFQKHETIEKIRSVHDRYVQARSSVLSSFIGVNLKDVAPDIFDNLKNIRDIHTSASYFMIITPYKQAEKLKTDIETVSKMLAMPNMDFITSYDKLCKLDEDVYNLNEAKKTFYENQDEIKQFVAKYHKSNYQMLDAQIVENVYKNLEDKFLDNAKKEYASVESAVKNSSLNDLGEEDLKKIDLYLAKQKLLNDRIFDQINKIKTDYIMKQNEEFYKKHKIM